MASAEGRSRAGAPTELLARARAHYARCAEAVERMIQRLAAGEIVPPGDFDATLRNFNKAFQTVFDLELNLETHRRKIETAGAGAGVLDLDAARAEIGRRLARLRAAGDG